jgi:TPR repeat protein
LTNGEGVRKNLDDAAIYFKPDAPGQYGYAIALENAGEVPKDLSGAAKYVKLSADQGHSYA